MDILESIIWEHVDIDEEGELIKEDETEEWVNSERIAEAVELEACIRLVMDRKELKRLAEYHAQYRKRYQEMDLEVLIRKLESAGFKCKKTDFQCYFINSPRVEGLPIKDFPFSIPTEKGYCDYGKRIELAIAYLAAATGQDRQALMDELVPPPPPPPGDQLQLLPEPVEVDPVEQATRELIATAKMFLLQNRLAGDAEEVSSFFQSIHKVEDLLEKGKQKCR